MMLDMTSEVRRDDNILLSPQRVIRRQRLRRCHIKYGATDAHKYVNAVLDKAARTLRPHES